MQSIVSRRDFRKLKNAVFVGCRAKALPSARDRKSTRLNSSHSQISYAVFCLKKKKINPVVSPLLTLWGPTPADDISGDSRLHTAHHKVSTKDSATPDATPCPPPTT